MASVNRTALVAIVGSCIVLFYVLKSVYKTHRSCIEKFQTMTPAQKEKLQELTEYANENLEKVAEKAKEQKELNKKVAKADLEFCDDFIVKRIAAADKWQKTQDQEFLVSLGMLLDILYARNKQQGRVTVC